MGFDSPTGVLVKGETTTAFHANLCGTIEAAITNVRLKLSNKTEFEALLNEVRGQLLDAQISFDIWLGLSPMEENGILDIMNSFKGFFIPTQAARP